MRSFLSIAMAGTLLVVGPVFADETTNTEQDISNIKQLEWLGDSYDGVKAHQEYLARHPLTPAQFSQKPKLFVQAASGSRRRISVLVDATLAPTIQTELDNYVDDVTADGYDVFVDTVSGGTPQEIKAWLKSRYAEGSEGFLLVGDITVAWGEINGSVFPCDLYYMDLDGLWLDKNNNGRFDYHVAGDGDQGPEVYVSRLYTATIHWDTERNMLNHYFQKTRAYRDGALKQPWRGLEYIDDDWHSMNVCLNRIFGKNVDRYDHGHLTTALDYFEKMSQGYYFSQVCVHGGATDQVFKGNPTDAAAYLHTYIHSPIAHEMGLKTTADDCVKIWVNGEIIAQDASGEQTHPIDLNAGWNTLLCKVVQSSGEFSFSANLEVFNSGNTRSLLSEDELTVDDLIFVRNDPLADDIEPIALGAFLTLGTYKEYGLNFSQLITKNWIGIDEATVQPNPYQYMAFHQWNPKESPDEFFALGYSHWTESVTYAYTTILADAQKDCQFVLDYDDAVCVWLNGENIILDNLQGDGSMHTAGVPVVLNQGENHLVIKAAQWDGEYGFIARFADYDGTNVVGIRNAVPELEGRHPIKWLMTDLHLGPDAATILNTDYLGGEAAIRPNRGDETPAGTWVRFRANDATGFIDLHERFENISAGRVIPENIHDADPPVLFTNLFTCGAANFLGENYIAGTHIFDSTWGLASIGSAKTGSMLCFEFFTNPLANARTVGQAFMDWFDSRAPFDANEQDWFYGMILHGDPTLMLYTRGDTNCDGVIDYLDIDPFVVSLVDREAFEAQYPNCNNLMADANRDGVIDVFDIDPFIERLLENTED